MRFAASRRLGLRNGSVITLRAISTPLLRHSLSALAFASQSLYSGWQNVAEVCRGNEAQRNDLGKP
jgi:hypothetical protein